MVAVIAARVIEVAAREAEDANSDTNKADARRAERRKAGARKGDGTKAGEASGDGSSAAKNARATVAGATGILNRPPRNYLRTKWYRPTLWTTWCWPRTTWIGAKSPEVSLHPNERKKAMRSAAANAAGV
jgi:hypothetical protein